MRVKTKLQIIALFMFSILIVLLAAVFLLVKETRRSSSNMSLADEIQSNFMERTSIRDQFFLYREVHMLNRWDESKQKSDHLLRQAKEQFQGTEYQPIIEFLIKSIDETAVIIHRIADNSNMMKSTTGNREILEELDKRLSSQLLLKATAIRDTMLILHDLSNQSAERSYRRLTIIVISLAGTVALFTLLLSVNLMRLIRMRLIPLHEGARNIGNGHMESRITVSGSDEFTELAHSVNAMTDKLVAEIEIRKTVEKALLEANAAIEEANKMALQKSEDTFRMVFNNAPVGLMLADSHGVVINCNQHFADIFGARRQDYGGMNLLATIPEGPVRQHLLDTLSDDTVHHYEGPYTSQVTGRELYLSISGQRASADHFIVIINDITAQTQAREALRVSEDHFRSFFELGLVGMAITSLEKGWLQYNDCLCTMLGYSHEELAEKSWAEMTHPDDLAADDAQFLRVLRGEIDAYSIDKRFIRKDGQLLHTALSVKCVRNLDGTPQHFVAMIHDISERKRIEYELRKSEAHFRTLVNTIPDLIWLKDTDGVYLACNATFERFFGAKAIDIIGKTDYDFVDKDLADFFRNHDIRAIEAGRPTSNEEWITFADDGHKALLETTKAPMFGANGQVAGVLGIGHDITGSRRAEEEKFKLETQLHQAQKMESIGSLAGGVAHDFNNKLSVILGCTYMAFTEENQAKRQALLDEVRKAAEQSADLTRQLLTFARKQTIAPRELNLNDTVTSMLKMLQRLIGENIRLSWQPAAELWALKLDPSQIDQVLANLCVNARDSVTTDGRITIETLNCVIDKEFCINHPDASPGKYVRLLVGDNGCGMDRETLERIFEPFFTTKETGKGTGLGLATVFGIVKQNNGFINVYSEPGLGTTFSIYFPRFAGTSPSVQNQGMAIDAPTGTETILMVEDELAILNMAAKILAKQGYTVLQANSPGEAIRLAREHAGTIDLLITDVIMPEMNGRDLADSLNSLNPQLKFLFMSGYTADAISQHGVLDDGVNFIQKPFSLPDLAAKVRDVLDGK